MKVLHEEAGIVGGGADANDLCAILASAIYLTIPFIMLWKLSVGLLGFYAGFCIGD